MIRSMTGYARAERAADFGRLSWEIRTVNHRYLDVQFRLPDDFRALEQDLRQLAAAGVARGKVEAALRYAAEGAAGAGLDLDPERLRQLRQALAAVAAELGEAQPVDTLRALAWPGVVREAQPDLAEVHAAALDLFGAALADLAAGRAREGERLERFLAQRCDELDQQRTRAAQLAPASRDAWLERVRARFKEMQVEVEPARIEQEFALTAQRLDVEEELSRLGAHLEEIRQVLKRDEPVGRRLDFLMQELNREANTLSSKSQDAELTRCAVEMKVVIEQMREQVQNIE